MTASATIIARINRQLLLSIAKLPASSVSKWACGIYRGPLARLPCRFERRLGIFEAVGKRAAAAIDRQQPLGFGASGARPIDATDFLAVGVDLVVLGVHRGLSQMMRRSV